MRRILGGLITALLLGSSVAGAAEPSPAQLASPAPLASIAPVLPAQGLPTAQYGAPAWVRAGTRMTWFGQAASVQNASYVYVEDEDGEWEDPVTGKRYRRTDKSGEGLPTAAGQGFTQLDVLALEDDRAVVSRALWSLALDGITMTIVPLGGSAGPAAAVDEAWVHPDLLATIEQQGYGDLMILRGQYTLGERQYPSISFVSKQTGAYLAYTYDRRTGAMLAMNTSVEGAANPVHGEGEKPPQGNTQVAWTKLVEVRHRVLPGEGAPICDWVERGRELTYRGEYAFRNALDPTAQEMSAPMEMTVELTPGGEGWASFTSSTTVDVGALSQPTQGKGVVGPTGLYCWDPDALAGMEEGQLLDEDEWTKARSAVEAIETRDGRPVVVMLTEAPGVSLRTTYDVATGVLLALELHQDTSMSTSRLELQELPG